ncbi:hypothetical protein AK812_SmicGene43960 [Symbiodinium microadriaticum]|uniref:Uncharacterized protein n=1 Tax=Symbiodinium microadriaticum TaxID=2951 RepID=A0A1Q9BZP5_SYMMI|nr:hypothetical protein AK812_SmicGene43960 [Symbiodinium microadriaticum]
MAHSPRLSVTTESPSECFEEESEQEQEQEQEAVPRVAVVPPEQRPAVPRVAGKRKNPSKRERERKQRKEEVETAQQWLQRTRDLTGTHIQLQRDVLTDMQDVFLYRGLEGKRCLPASLHGRLPGPGPLPPCVIVLVIVWSGARCLQ